MSSSSSAPSMANGTLLSGLFFLLLLLLLGLVNSQTHVQEQSVLLKLKQFWQNPSSLQPWTLSNSDHCSWPFIGCTNNSVTELSLVDRNLAGTIPPFICDLINLSKLDLSFNRIPGEFPRVLYNCSKLEYLNLSHNSFIGEIPRDIDRLSGLRCLSLAVNSFSGGLPTGIVRLSQLSNLEVQSNNLSGNIPSDLLTMKDLKSVCVSSNYFSGPLPTDFGRFPMIGDFQASDNLFTGPLPIEFTALPFLSILLLDGNRLSGELPSGILSWKSLITLNLSRNHFSGQIPPQLASLPSISTLDLSRNQLSGTIPPNLKPSLLNLSSNFLIGKIPNQLETDAYATSFLDNPHLCAAANPLMNLPICNADPKRSYKAILIAVVSAASALAFLLLFFFIRFHRRRSRRSETEKWKLTAFHKLSFTEEDILSALEDNNNVIGSGGAGKVFRVTLPGSSEVAVKRIWKHGHIDEKLESQFDAEVKTLSETRHRNIMKLYGCMSSDHNSKLLIYEYFENRSLDLWLRGNYMLDWPQRLKIAEGTAEGLCYMHHHCSPPIIHRDLKPSNILLDSQLQAKIADFGLAKMLSKPGQSNTMSTLAGSFGYMAPEYAQTGRASEKVDIYSFGVVLLELTTGKEANKGDESTCLAEWARRYYQDGEPIEDALDKEVVREGCYLEEMTTVFKVGILCTATLPSSRPSMKEVLQILPH